MDKQRLKDALISVLVGSCVAFITVLLQGLTGILNDIPAEVPGSVIAIAKYGIKWLPIHHV